MIVYSLTNLNIIIISKSKIEELKENAYSMKNYNK